MLRLVVSNNHTLEQSDDRLDHFQAGDVLEHPSRAQQVLVMACGVDCTTAMLMPLPDGNLYEARIEQMAGWTVAYIPGPRLVEIHRKSSGKVEWSSYVPDIHSAVALWQKLEWAEPRDFDVEIYTQHISELKLLDDIGYF